MYIIINAVKNLIRNKSRNIIVGMIFITILTAVTIALVIHNTSNSMIQDYKDHIGVEARIVADWATIRSNSKPEETIKSDGSIHMSQTFEAPEITLDEYQKYANSKYVKNYSVTARAAYASDTLKKVPYNMNKGEKVVELDGMSLEELKKFFGTTEEEIVKKFGKEILTSRATTVGSIYGYSNASLVDEFKSGKRKLSSGRMFQNDNECVISKEFAKYNNLQVGDTISITGAQKIDTDVIKLTITGLFEDLVENVENTTFRAGLNDILVSFNTLKQSNFSFISKADVTFYLMDIEASGLFLDELRTKGLNKYFTLSSDNEAYKKVVKPIEKISGMAVTFLFAILVLGVLIIVFLSLAAIRERKYEIGVLRAIGMKKPKIAMGLLCETMVLIFICLSVSFACGSILSQPVSDRLLSSRIESTQNNVDVNASSSAVSVNESSSFVSSEEIQNNNTITDGNDNQPPKVNISKKIKIDIDTYLKIIAIAIALGLISSLAGILYIAKFEPAKILSERN